MGKYNWEGIKSLQVINDEKYLRKIVKQLLLMFYILKIKKYILPTFQNTTQSMKNK